LVYLLFNILILLVIIYGTVVPYVLKRRDEKERPERQKAYKLQVFTERNTIIIYPEKKKIKDSSDQ